MKLFDEYKVYSDIIDQKNCDIYDAIRQGSLSDMDALHRKETIGRVFKNFGELKREYSKEFTSYAESEIISNQYFNATVAGLAKSTAGYFTIERDMDASSALLWFLDTYDLATGSAIMPNIGPDSVEGYSNLLTTSSAMATGTYAYTWNTATKLLPGSLKITLVMSAVTYTVKDDGTGGLLAAPGILSAGSVNYSTGSITFTTVANPVTATDTYAIEVAENQTSMTSGNRFENQLKRIVVDTYPELLSIETNLAGMAAMNKALKISGQDVALAKLIELYTKKVNRDISIQLNNNLTGTPSTITLDQNNFKDYSSLLMKFSSNLKDVDQALAEKSYKGCKATAYLVGAKVASTFRKLSLIGEFQDEPQSYINDLVGFYKGIPVVEDANMDTDTGIAVHKTTDGNLAPILRGIFLPLTNTPAIGNYNNPTQLVQGTYYQEANKSIMPALTQKFTITYPNGI